MQLDTCTILSPKTPPFLLAKYYYHSGGSILSTLLNSQHPALKSIRLSALARGQDKARVLTERGLSVELFDDLDQTELLEGIASNYDGK